MRGETEHTLFKYNNIISFLGKNRMPLAQLSEQEKLEEGYNLLTQDVRELQGKVRAACIPEGPLHRCFLATYARALICEDQDSASHSAVTAWDRIRVSATTGWG